MAQETNVFFLAYRINPDVVRLIHESGNIYEFVITKKCIDPLIMFVDQYNLKITASDVIGFSVIRTTKDFYCEVIKRKFIKCIDEEYFLKPFSSRRLNRTIISDEQDVTNVDKNLHEYKFKEFTGWARISSPDTEFISSMVHTDE